MEAEKEIFNKAFIYGGNFHPKVNGCFFFNVMANYRLFTDSDGCTLRCFNNLRDETTIAINEIALISLTREDVEQLICDLQSLLTETLE